jgi:hypothetical protein
MLAPTTYKHNLLQVINAFVHLSNVENDSASYISTFQAAMIRDNLLGPEDRMKKRKTIAEKCQGKHLVRKRNSKRIAKNIASLDCSHVLNSFFIILSRFLCRCI